MVLESWSRFRFVFLNWVSELRIQRTNSNCPYAELSDESFWRRSVSDIDLQKMNPMANVAFELTNEDVIASAGSCFAQHISRYLKNNGYSFLVTEPRHQFVPSSVATEYNYEIYPARFGNIYTSRQLLQLIKRAFGEFQPSVEPYQNNGRWLDPFRPFVQPSGFVSVEDLQRDQKHHLASVRKMFLELDVFIFTLGLTECWESVEDGAILPICPGCGAGEYDPERYRFKNLTITEVIQDMNEFVEILRRVNPTSKLILTVSPVPLIATNSGDHVLHATVYSKSVLRVAAQELRSRYPFVDYFPSFEIITADATRGKYFDKDLRSILETGVNHVMRCFFKSYMGLELGGETTSDTLEKTDGDSQYNKLSELIMEVICDEEILDESIE